MAERTYAVSPFYSILQVQVHSPSPPPCFQIFPSPPLCFQIFPPLYSCSRLMSKPAELRKGLSLYDRVIIRSCDHLIIRSIKILTLRKLRHDIFECSCYSYWRFSPLKQNKVMYCSSISLFFLFKLFWSTAFSLLLRVVLFFFFGVWKQKMSNSASLQKRVCIKHPSLSNFGLKTVMFE